MSNRDQLPYLLELLDDDTPLVRQAVVRELAAFGSGLFEELNSLPIEVTPKDKYLLNNLLAGPRRSYLKRQWSSWFEIHDDHLRLEAALTLLAEYQSGLDFQGQLKGILDALAGEYRSFHPVADAYSLADFLFKDKGFLGAQDDYYNPSNSNLIYVVKQRRGIPISLSCVYMLVGHRLGLTIRGCNSPRHFLTIIDNGSSKELVDCFHAGAVIGEKEIITLSQESSLKIEEALKMEADAVAIIRRILGNLIFAYQQIEQEKESFLMVHLLKEIQLFQDQRALEQSKTANEWDVTCFKIGQKVRHVDEGYRGLIVDYDLYCAGASESFLQDDSPDYNQPWYKVLVHRTDQSLYVPHSQLENDQDNGDIQNPLIGHFFTRADSGSYIRNQMPWIE